MCKLLHLHLTQHSRNSCTWKQNSYWYRITRDYWIRWDIEPWATKKFTWRKKFSGCYGWSSTWYCKHWPRNSGGNTNLHYAQFGATAGIGTTKCDWQFHNKDCRQPALICRHLHLWNPLLLLTISKLRKWRSVLTLLERFVVSTAHFPYEWSYININRRTRIIVFNFIVNNQHALSCTQRVN